MTPRKPNAKRGRPRLESRGVSVHWAIKIPPSIAECVDAIAKRGGASRSEVIRGLLEFALSGRSKRIER